MKSPWVSRPLFQFVLDALAYEKAARESERKRYDDLLARYHMLKLQGFTEQPSVTPMSVAPRTADPVQRAINIACAGKDIRVRRAMLEQVQRDRDAKIPEADIERRILTGHRPMDEFTESTPTANPGASAAAS